MRRPRPRGSRITLQRMRGWVNEFAGYRHGVTEGRVRDWLAQFDEIDQDLAARILDAVEFVTHEHMSAAFRQVLGSLPGWDPLKTKRQGKWRFVAYSASAGESGDSMLHKFRHANGLADACFNELFIHRSDLLRAGLGVNDTVVLVDDFVGTGDQVIRAWEEAFGELLAEVGKTYLVVVAARDKAMARIRNKTELELVPHIQLSAYDNVFAPECSYFNDTERSRLENYGKRASRGAPKGHGDCGLVIVFAHGCPNNTIPILHSAHRKWEGLFRRYD